MVRLFWEGLFYSKVSKGKLGKLPILGGGYPFAESVSHLRKTGIDEDR